LKAKNFWILGTATHNGSVLASLLARELGCDGTCSVHRGSETALVVHVEIDGVEDASSVEPLVHRCVQQWLGAPHPERTTYVLEVAPYSPSSLQFWLVGPGIYSDAFRLFATLLPRFPAIQARLIDATTDDRRIIVIVPDDPDAVTHISDAVSEASAALGFPPGAMDIVVLTSPLEDFLRMAWSDEQLFAFATSQLGTLVRPRAQQIRAVEFPDRMLVPCAALIVPSSGQARVAGSGSARLLADNDVMLGFIPRGMLDDSAPGAYCFLQLLRAEDVASTTVSSSLVTASVQYPDALVRPVVAIWEQEARLQSPGPALAASCIVGAHPPRVANLAPIDAMRLVDHWPRRKFPGMGHASPVGRLIRRPSTEWQIVLREPGPLLIPPLSGLSAVLFDRSFVALVTSPLGAVSDPDAPWRLRYAILGICLGERCWFVTFEDSPPEDDELVFLVQSVPRVS
jgi:hypothetical protein